ncbi:MAG: hypothetical protein LBS19_10995 [Clostridiales bacterium]|jgi:phage terminase Nu1 subunit (DNA packaging protein)|nr:hypothetical protein [Clostridiales bacterium]
MGNGRTAGKKLTNKRMARAEEIAAVTGVSVPRIHQLRQEGVIEFAQKTGTGPGSAGLYDYDETIHRLLCYYREKADMKTAPDEALEKEKILHEKAKRETAELKLKALRSQLHHTEDIKHVHGFIVARLRTGLLSLPLGVAPQLTGIEDINQIAGIIDERLRQALEEVFNFTYDDFAQSESEYIKGLEDMDEQEDPEQTEDSKGEPGQC